MAAIAAFTQKVFALNNPSSLSLTVFGSTAAGSTTYSSDPATIQTTTWLNGWLPATILNTTKRLPIYEDMNSAFFVTSSSIALIQQEGIVTWLSDKEYRLNSIVKKDGTSQLFLSLQNANTGHALTDGTWWVQCGDLQYIPSAPLGLTGMIAPFPANVAPSGWLALSGQLVSRVTYSALWTYAQASGNISANDGAWTAGQFSPGDGTTTFRVPDGRGYFIRGWASGGSIDSGRLIGSVQLDDFESHVHSGAASNFTFAPSPGGGAPGSGPVDTGATGGTETRPINFAALMCIKY